MKTNFLRKAVACFALALPLFAACESDPVKPENEVEHKHHEAPTKMTVQLVECHVHGDWNKVETTGGGLHQNPESPAKHMKKIQEMTYELTPNGWALAKDSQDKFYVVRAGDYKHGTAAAPAPVYLVFIKYYAADGDLINAHFLTQGQDLIHQHFFSAHNVKPAFGATYQEGDDVTTNIFDYKYADTDPWNKSVKTDGAKVIGATNPIGFKGAIRFLRACKTFDLKISLYHGYKSKIDPLTGKLSPFHTPGKALLQQGEWDVNIAFPVVVYMDRETDFVDIDDDTNLDSIAENGLDDDSNRVIRQIMDAFGISWREALQEFVDYTYHGGDHDHATIWL